jgi:2-phospho-L-lactate guanylyltransferase
MTHPPSRRDCVALIPFRCPRHGKSRLRRELPDTFCDALVEAMFRDVVTALRSSRISASVALLHGPCGVSAARRADVDWMVEPSNIDGLNGAIRWAAGELSARRALVATADLPALTAAHVNGLLDRSEDVVVAPTSDGGTGGLLLKLPSAVAPSYGEHSGHRHLQAGIDGGLQAVAVCSEGFAVDVDDTLSLAQALALGSGLNTNAVLKQAPKIDVLVGSRSMAKTGTP